MIVYMYVWTIVKIRYRRQPKWTFAVELESILIIKVMKFNFVHPYCIMQARKTTRKAISPCAFFVKFLLFGNLHS